ncbi:E3 ubiquitin-protein ligase tom1 [Tritrichomonas musculus]|uniref:HECT-type E3 ubiquitin transferase n=1 Tax=Tritrichomonas musculus TaxID=1915356 RepID=A0ABR2GSJ7_9EUKA
MDWVSTISKEIIDTGAIITTPDGEYYMINENYDDTEIFKLIGQVLGVSFNNRQSNDLKLMSSIWKFIFDENIDINDMREYDYYIYNSLMSITQNDVSNMYLTFVDSDGDELCYDGNNKDVTNYNKNEYIDLIIQKKLISDYDKINAIKEGFESAVKISDVKHIGWEDIRNFIKGQDNIDVQDWRSNCMYSSDDIEYVDCFFEVISSFDDEDLKKLLKFITGTSVVPVEGFEYFDKLGGKINIKFTDSSKQSFPISHTCYNQIELPRYESHWMLKEKLLTAIEVENFGFS